jgi:hypothetical protein
MPEQPPDTNTNQHTANGLCLHSQASKQLHITTEQEQTLLATGVVVLLFRFRFRFRLRLRFRFRFHLRLRLRLRLPLRLPLLSLLPSSVFLVLLLLKLLPALQLRFTVFAAVHTHATLERMNGLRVCDLGGFSSSENTKGNHFGKNQKTNPRQLTSCL